MKKLNILGELGKKEYKPEKIAEKVVRNQNSLAEVFEGIFSSNKQVKNRSAKILNLASGKYPDKLHSQIGFFIELLDSKDTILKWNAIIIIANLTSIDKENKFRKIFQKYYGFLSDESMVTAAIVVDNSAAIAKNKPELRAKIINELLKVEKIPRNQECKNILIGKVIKFFEEFDDLGEKDKIISFVKRQLNNSRNATKTKAEKYLKKLN